MSSKLTVIIGPMKAGKTDNIIRRYNKYKSINKRVCIINHTYDSIRTHKNNVIKTHNGFLMQAITTNSLIKVIPEEEYMNAEIVIIDEGQFFGDLKIFIENELETTSKSFYVYGLSCDINMKKIGEILDIIPMADSIEHFTAYCSICKEPTPAPFTKTDEKITNQIFVGDEIYYPVCRYHFYNKE